VVSYIEGGLVEIGSMFRAGSEIEEEEISKCKGVEELTKEV